MSKKKKEKKNIRLGSIAVDYWIDWAWNLVIGFYCLSEKSEVRLLCSIIVCASLSIPMELLLSMLWSVHDITLITN